MKTILILLLMMLSFYLGADLRQQDIEDRALSIELKECYNWQDIEYAIFAEVQE
jgi:hypothetical protein